MDLFKAMQERHSVRAYTDAPISANVREKLDAELAVCNAAGGLSMRLVYDEPQAFSSFLARYGKFSGVRNYIVVAGRKADDLNERAGYWGEKAVLFAQSLGLNTCWAALTFRKGAARKFASLAKGEKLVCTIALGYGKTQGVPHKSKPLSAVIAADDPPAWFLRGAEAALLAPTAVNQQKFRFVLAGERAVLAERTGGFYGDIDLGIVKYHFEQGAGRENFEWVCANENADRAWR